MDEITKLTERLYGLTQNVTNHYIQSKYKHNFVGNGDDFIYSLRSSIQHRLQAIGWHYLQMKIGQDSAERQYFHALKEGTEWEHMLAVHSIQYFLFDDIVFNLISLFDYIGNTAGYFLKGEAGKKIKWKGIAKSGRDSANELSKHSIAKSISKYDSQLVTKFESYRAEIFHYGSNTGSVGAKYEFPSSGRGLKIEIAVPEKFKKIFQGFNIEGESEVVGYSKYAITSSFSMVENLLNELLRIEVEALPLQY